VRWSLFNSEEEIQASGTGILTLLVGLSARILTLSRALTEFTFYYLFKRIFLRARESDTTVL
jgi:hypothetical protein